MKIIFSIFLSSAILFGSTVEENLVELEKTGQKPFVSCSILTKPKTMDDFGLGCDKNPGKCTFLRYAAKSKKSIDKITNKSKEFKEYVSCLLLYGGLIAQNIKNDEFKSELQDKDIKNTYSNILIHLKDAECKLDGRKEDITCGYIKVHLTAEPYVTYGEINIYGKDSYYGHQIEP